MAKKRNTSYPPDRTWFLYELINTMGTVEWVGVTFQPAHRFYQHTQVKPNPKQTGGYGKFYGRLDIHQHLVHEFTDRKEALRAEVRLKREYGMPIGELAGLAAVDKTLAGQRGAAAQADRIVEMGRESMATIRVCPHCGKSSKGAIYGRWHGKNCKWNPDKNG